jgi:hypothetical protein
VRRRCRTVLAAALAVAALAPAGAAASEWEGLFGLEVGGGYAAASLRTAASPSVLSGGAVRARLSYGLTDALGVAATGQMAWYQSRRPIASIEYEDETGALVSALGYGAEVTDTELRDIGVSLVYALDVMRVVPFLGAGVASMQVLERSAGVLRVDHDVVLRFEIGADIAALPRFRIGASAVFDIFLTQRSELSAQTVILLRAAFVLGPAKLGDR